MTQQLFSASLIADVLPRRYERDPERGAAALADLRRLVRGAQAEMRALLLELRPAALEEGSLAEHLRQLADATMGRAPIEVELAVSGGEASVPGQARVALYRIAQEALNNSVKHAGASTVRVRLRALEDGVVLDVADDGRGFAAGVGNGGHHGLRMMRERAAEAGVALRVRSAPGAGTAVEAVWPASSATWQGSR